MTRDEQLHAQIGVLMKDYELRRAEMTQLMSSGISRVGLLVTGTGLAIAVAGFTDLPGWVGILVLVGALAIASLQQRRRESHVLRLAEFMARLEGRINSIAQQAYGCDESLLDWETKLRESREKHPVRPTMRVIHALTGYGLATPIEY